LLCAAPALYIYAIQASVKNFQLVTDEDDETVLLQFGKVRRGGFFFFFFYF
jgi:hypothetical protein